MSIESQPARQHRFFTALFTKDWPPEKHLRACYGFTMREHAEVEHPGQVELVGELALASVASELREAWLFGFRFRDAHPEPGIPT